MENKSQYDFINNYCNRENEIPFAAAWTNAYNYLIEEAMVSPSEETLNTIKTRIINKGVKENDLDLERLIKREFTIQYFEMKYGITRPDIIL